METADASALAENANGVERTADKTVNSSPSMVSNVERNNESVDGSLESQPTSIRKDPVATPTSEETQLSRPRRQAKVSVVARRAPPKRQPNRATPKKDDKKEIVELHSRDSKSDRSGILVAEQPSTSNEAQERAKIRRSVSKEREEATAKDAGEKSYENSTPIPVEVELKRPSRAKRAIPRKSRGRR
ncbi:unnamed protein product [Cylicostephanus goldi]|uniref:Uncharacterized protein n=1 Tax=Cylicostephanus goldi TaxID=71465 RepID=A0A3P6QDZ2_CYLGO|nr:unnamed protein product [Cylicostephanus goldi]